MTQFLESDSIKSDLYEILLSEAKDFGVRELKAIQNKRIVLENAFDFSSLEGAFTGVPAIIVGAGPSLELDGKYLDSLLKNKALILSGGSALEWMEKRGVTPHFSLLFDPYCKEERFMKAQELGSRALFTLRANSSVVSSWKGPKWLLSTEAFHLWETAWHPTQSMLDVGWNVATALGAFAKFLGCSSLFFIGVDLNIGKEGELYPQGILTTPEDEKRECRELEWKLGREWVASFAKEAKEEGTQVVFGENSPLPHVEKLSLQVFVHKYCSQTHLIEELIQVHENKRAPLLVPFDQFEEALRESYFNTKKLCEEFFDTEQVETLFLEPFYQKILQPLWKIWSPRFLETCLERGILWREKEQEIAFILNVLGAYEEML